MYKISEGIEFENIDNQIIAINTEKGRFYNLNSVGYYIIFHLKNESIEVISKSLASHYNKDIDLMKEVVEKYIEELIRQEIITYNGEDE